MNRLLQRRVWRWCGLVVLLALLAPFSLPSHDAAAHAFLERSSPSANDVINHPPAEFRLRFTEPLEPAYSRAELYDATGTLVETEASRLADDPHEMILPLPHHLPIGTYTVQWRNVSAADGHAEVGYVPFTVGSQADVVTPELPDVPGISTVAGSLGMIGRWLGLLGVAAAVGSFITWLLVVRPSIEPAPSEWQTRAAQRTRQIALIGVAVTVVGSTILAVAQVMTGSGVFSLGGIVELITDTRFGYLWLLRIAGLGAFTLLVFRPVVWGVGISARLTSLLLVIAGLVLLTFSLLSHAAAQPVGRLNAIAVDWLHLAGASIWIGGLITLLVGVIQLRGLTGDQRRAIYAAAIPRFSTVAIASVVVLTVTGIYSAWLQVGNLHALRETTYGRTLAVKLVIVVAMLALGAINLRVLGPQMLEKARSRVHFARTVLAEVVLAAGLLLAVGVMISLPPARDVIVAEAGSTIFHLTTGEIHGTLYITPGATGPNHYTAEISPRDRILPDDTQVLLRVSRESDVAGLREIELIREDLATSRFEAEGSELSVVGEWDLELIVRRPDMTDWRDEVSMTVSDVPPEAQVPSQPLRFGGITPAIATLGGGVGIVLIVVGLRRRNVKQHDRRLTIQAGIGLVLIALITLPLARTDADATTGGNPIPMTVESVAIGREHYLEHCAVCHGQQGFGDGVLASSINPPPTDLRENHVDDHTDGELHWWFRNGIPGTAMPGFEDEMTDEQLWHIVNYVRSIRHPIEEEATP